MSKIIKKDQIDENLSLGSRLDLDDRPEAQLTSNKKVIRSEEAGELKEARTLLQKAKIEADKMKQKARDLYAQVEAKTEQSRREGFEVGRQEGIASVSELIAEINQKNQNVLEQIEQEAIALIYEIGQKIVGDALKTDDEAIVGMIRQALQSSLGVELTLFVNPEDLERVKANESKLMTVLQATQTMHIKASEKVRPGGCMVESELGTIDAELDMQLEAIKRALGLER